MRYYPKNPVFERFEDALTARARQASEINEQAYMVGYMLSMLEGFAEESEFVRMRLGYSTESLENFMFEVEKSKQIEPA